MDDEPTYAADHVVTLTLGSAITIPETTNGFAIKRNHLTLVKGNQFDGTIKTVPHKHIHEFLRICDIFKYRDTKNEAVCLMMFPLSHTGEAKTWLDKLNEGTIETGRNDYNRDNYQSNSDDKPDLQKQLRNLIKAQHSTNSFVKDTFMDLKNKLKTTTKNHQASIQHLEAKFDKFANKQSGRPSRSLPSNTQPNPKGNSSKPYQPLQAQNEHVNVVFTRSGKIYDPPMNPNDQPNDSETPINFDSDDEDDEPTQPKEPKPVKETPIPKPYKPKIPYPQSLRK
ncbi:hypothetical protein Tco_1540334 [Tanacetum coccineum]